MAKICVILDFAHSSSGEAAILDFPPGGKPFLKMKLKDMDGITWVIEGMGLSVVIGVLKEKFDTFYDSEIVWDCFLKAESSGAFQTDKSTIRFWDEPFETERANKILDFITDVVNDRIQIKASDKIDYRF